MLFGSLTWLGQSQGGASVVKGLLDLSIWVKAGAFLVLSDPFAQV